MKLSALTRLEASLVLGVSQEDYASTHEVTAPEEFEWKSFERGFSFTNVDLMGFGWEIHGAKVSTLGAEVDLAVASAEGAVFHHEVRAKHQKEQIFYTKVGLEADVLLRVDALVDIGLGTPFR